jgi:hypothetical protein
MSDLTKMTVVVKNYKDSEGEGLDRLYKRVRMEDQERNTFYFKNVVVPKYLQGKGAFAHDVPRTWYFKKLDKNSIIIIAFETKTGKVEYDLDDLRDIARSTVFKGFVYGIGSIPAAMIVSTATFGLGLLIIPFGLWYFYRFVIKVPAMLSRKTLQGDLASHGVGLSGSVA